MILLRQEVISIITIILFCFVILDYFLIRFIKSKEQKDNSEPIKAFIEHHSSDCFEVFLSNSTDDTLTLNNISLKIKDKELQIDKSLNNYYYTNKMKDLPAHHTIILTFDTSKLLELTNTLKNREKIYLNIESDDKTLTIDTQTVLKELKPKKESNYYV